MKKTIITFIAGMLLMLSVNVFASVLYNAKDIEFTSNDDAWQVNNVEYAIKDLKLDVLNNKELLSSGTATSSDLKEGTSAVVNGEIINGSFKLSGLIYKKLYSCNYSTNVTNANCSYTTTVEYDGIIVGNLSTRSANSKLSSTLYIKKNGGTIVSESGSVYQIFKDFVFEVKKGDVINAYASITGSPTAATGFIMLIHY